MSNNYRINGSVEINKNVLNGDQFDNVITILEAVAPDATEDNDMYRFWYTHDSEYGGDKNSVYINYDAFSTPDVVDAKIHELMDNKKFKKAVDYIGIKITTIGNDNHTVSYTYEYLGGNRSVEKKKIVTIKEDCKF